MPRDPTGHASSSPIPESDSRVEADVGTMPNCPSAEDTDMLSATNSEVESAMNHRRRRAIPHGGIFSEEAFNAFNFRHAYIRAAQDGLARATDQYVKDIRVRKFISMYSSSP